jgi:hypothetical protein
VAEHEFAGEFLFTMELNWIQGESHDFTGPFGRRLFRHAAKGTAAGPRLTGSVLPSLSTDYGRRSEDGTLGHIDGYVSLEADTGAAVLMQVRGRTSPRYGAGNSRLQIMFTADGDYAWLGHRQAVGIGRTEGAAEVVDVYALEVIAPGAGPAGRFRFDTEPVLRRISEHNPSLRHHFIKAPTGGRYLSVAEAGLVDGPRVQGQYLHGYCWSAHRAAISDGAYYLNLDVNTLVEATDGSPILMSYTGVVGGPEQSPGTWLTAMLLEAPVGSPHAWLNEVLAFGAGRNTGEGAEYHVYALR